MHFGPSPSVDKSKQDQISKRRIDKAEQTSHLVYNQRLASKQIGSTTSSFWVSSKNLKAKCCRRICSQPGIDVANIQNFTLGAL
jgi:hypothetical protein